MAFGSRSLHALSVGALALLLCPVHAAAEDYTDLDLTELAALSAEVFSASKKTQKVVETAASVQVIDGEEIRRSGHTTLPEVLRLVPGVNVGRITSNRWAVGVRGFNSEFASQLLVLIDGRVVYTPTFSGVYWNLQDVLLEDVERIEVIRGPGAAIWGSNAVAGVINVITKSAEATSGTLASVLVGDEERLGMALRTGGGDDGAHYRAFAKMAIRDSFVGPSGESRGDEWRAQRGGLRLDLSPGERDQVSFDSAVYHEDTGDAVRDYDAAGLTTGIPTDTRVNDSQNGGHLIGRWRRSLAEGGELELQGYYDQLLNRGSLIQDVRHSTSLELQHRTPWATDNDVVWGLGYRRSDFRIDGNNRIQIGDATGTDVTYSGFGQIEHRLSDTVRLVGGSKLEWNDISGWEVQPTARALWLPSSQQQVWAGVSRAVRTPSRGEREGLITQAVIPPNALFLGSPATPVQTIGNPRLGSEVLIAYELGYRRQFGDRASLDVSAFWNDYENQVATRAIPPLGLSQLVTSRGHSRALGGEALVDVRALDWWRVSFGYSLFDLASGGGNGFSQEKVTPRHQGRISSYMKLPLDLELDSTLYLIDEAEDLTGTKLDRYARVDLRLGYRPGQHWLVELVAQNAFDRHHLESTSLFSPDTQTEVERAIFARVTWRR
jgi:iron complex outermembrane receptor protein